MKIIATINMSLDGNCDHLAMTPDTDVHQHYTELLNTGDMALYGRITYQLMQFWQEVLTKPTENPAMDEFAKAIDRIPKLVFSNTLKETNWNTAELAKIELIEQVRILKQTSGGDVFVGCRSLINQLLDKKLIDELQICIHPVIVGKGPYLFNSMLNRTELKLVRTKHFMSGAFIHVYEL